MSNMSLKIVCKSCDTIILLIKQLQYLISLFENFKIIKKRKWRIIFVEKENLFLKRDIVFESITDGLTGFQTAVPQ